MEITLDDVKKSQKKIAEIVRVTPLEKSQTLTQLVGQEIFLKYENMQKTGSFKLRGATSKILSLSEEGKREGVIAASAGNHAQGVAFAATKSNMLSKIVMPEGAPITKIMATQGYGAEVILKGLTYDDCYQHAMELAKEKKLNYVHAFNDKDVIAGQGTIGLEIISQLQDVKNIIVPIGGGGLLAGILLAVKELNPSIRVIGVQAEGASAMVNSVKMGKLTQTDMVNTIADGIAVKKPGDLTFTLINKYIDDVVTVDEEEIARAILLLLERNKTMVEGAAAVTVAALIYNKIDNLKGKTVAVLSGGNIDPNILSRIIERGMIKAGKTTFLEVVLQDIPGSLQRLLGTIALHKANVIAVNHDRLNPKIPIKYAKVNLMLETRDLAHGENIVKELLKSGYSAQILENL
ncbi:threonine ammonia-lyase [Alkalicella caledoniensis]|uniref:L-threonine dehydratase catabolic TdcB n=1 Tax=Alkalicella caledoniensis TaxID=2731377 RepID=A0A7G9W867_ALKCA|nr:threonine ammonia-lyase [Alkalicella caledoniensis]QNO14879.1 threonine ammonia-lyase [Alkalicella caledoniensis]